MKKLRIKKSVSKRFKITKSGKIMFAHQMSGHLKTNKSKSNLRRKAVPSELTGKFAKKITKMLGAKHA